jgi:hypothetical protein
MYIIARRVFNSWNVFFFFFLIYLSLCKVCSEVPASAATSKGKSIKKNTCLAVVVIRRVKTTYGRKYIRGRKTEHWKNLPLNPPPPPS